MSAPTIADTGVRAITGGLLLIPLRLIHPGANVRPKIGDVTELAASIKAQGLLEPIQVTADADGSYTVHDGHRRLAAMRKLDMAAAPAILRRPMDDTSRVIQQITIHNQRQPVDPIAEAKALHELFTGGMSREAIARTIGRSTVWVRDRLALVYLTPGEQEQVSAGQLPVVAAVAELRERRHPSVTQPTQPRVTRPAGPDARCVALIAAWLDGQGQADAAALVRHEFGEA